MSHYNAYTSSNRAKIDDPEGLQEFISDHGIVPTPTITDDDHLRIEGESTLDFEGEPGKEFLAEIQPALEETLVVRSVGYWHDDLDLPHATQWVVEPEGDIHVEQFSHPRNDDTPAESDDTDEREALAEQGHALHAKAESISEEADRIAEGLAQQGHSLHDAVEALSDEADSLESALAEQGHALRNATESASE